jgi:hypothetical protein
MPWEDREHPETRERHQGQHPLQRLPGHRSGGARRWAAGVTGMGPGHWGSS